MRTQLPGAFCLLVAAGLGACTTMKRDDHSYTYIYQHNAGPQPQVLETVSTQSTRTRRYTTPEDSPLPSYDQQKLPTEDLNTPDLRADPIPPPPLRNPHLGRAVPAYEGYFEQPAGFTGPQYVIPEPVSYCRPAPAVYYSHYPEFRRRVRTPSVLYTARFAMPTSRP
jgi:hypothetical protein